MVLPSDFITHEERFSKDTLEAIDFQYDRLILDSTDINIFLNRFLKVSNSPTLPPNDYEIWYLAAKVAYFLSKYEYFDSEIFQEKYTFSAGSQIWYALALGAKGKVNESVNTLETILERTNVKDDPMVYIECLGVIAQIYFIRGSKFKEQLDDVINKINDFKEEFESELDNFDQMFLPAYLILSRIKSQQLSPEKIIKEVSKLLKKAKKAKSNYFVMQFQLDLIQAKILANKLDDAKKLLDEIFQLLENLKFKAIEAKAIRILGQLYEKNQKFDLAEKNYMIAKNKYTTLEDQIGIAHCVSLLANLAELQEEASKAEQFYEEALAISEKTSDFYSMSNALTALGRVNIKKGLLKKSLENYSKSLSIAKDNNFDYFLPSIYDGLTYVNFLAGDFKSAVDNKSNSINYKEKLDYSDRSILYDHIRLGELNAITGALDLAFNSFETALNICTKLDIKDDWYFDILNWLFEISSAINKLALAESYMGRADLFASIHNSREENAQALISRIRFLIQKQEYDQAEKLLDTTFALIENLPQPLTTALALIEKAAILLYKLLEKEDEEILEKILETLDDMLFISLDLEFLPLTMYTKKVLAKVLTYKKDFDEGIEELVEAIDLAEELGMKKFEDTIKIELTSLKEMKDNYKSIEQEELKQLDEKYLREAIDFIRQTFWLVQASEHQREFS